jgi:hypothetical protein
MKSVRALEGAVPRGFLDGRLIHFLCQLRMPRNGGLEIGLNGLEQGGLASGAEGAQ